MAKHIAVILTLLLALTGCNHSRDRRLEHLYALTESAPQAALEGLDSLSRDAFGPDDRLFYDLVALKAADKLYIRHTSDSIILPIVARFASDPVYGPEVLYYAARVYSDLGDYPTASDYFHRAYTASASNPDTEVRAKIASQAGRLNNTLHKYSQAIPYLKESLRIDSLLKDTVNLMYDHQLLGSVYTKSNMLDSANITLHAGLEWATLLSDTAESKINLYLANLHFLKGNVDSALTLIRGVPEKQKPQFRSLSLLYATKIYLAAGIQDSAYHYVSQLIRCKGPKNRREGYRYLLNYLNQYIAPDSMLLYVNAYNQAVSDYFDAYEAEEASFSEAQFNYEVHKHKQLEAELKQKTYLTRFYLALAGCLTLILIIVWLKWKKLVRTLHSLRDIQKSIDESKPRRTELIFEEPDHHKLIAKIKEQVMAADIDPNRHGVHPMILESEAYSQLQSYVKNKKAIGQKNPLWDDLLAIIDTYHIDFCRHLNILLNNKLKEADWESIILIKCGINIQTAAYLLSVRKSTASERRNSICKRIFGEDFGGAFTDKLICLL